METHRVGIIMNGVTGRMGTNQHLERSIIAIRKQGGVKIGPSDRHHARPHSRRPQRRQAETTLRTPRRNRLLHRSCLRFSQDPKYPVYFDAQTTPLRFDAASKAIAAGKHLYCEKPVASTSAEAMQLVKKAEAAGVKNGVVQDKLWLPGMRKLKHLIDTGFFGRILSVRGEFGYWVFTGEDQPAQRPSWNYRKEDGGGIIIDMLCHWRYVIDNLFGNVKASPASARPTSTSASTRTASRYKCTADDSAYATFDHRKRTSSAISIPPGACACAATTC